MEWVFRATRSKVDSLSTMILADKRGFVCRTGRTVAGAWAPNVQAVAVGDTLNYYYVQAGKKAREFGLYEVIAADAHDRPELFGAQVEGSTLYEVAPGELHDYLDQLGGYTPDPITGTYTGWLIRRVSRAMPYDAKMFTGLATLQQLVDPEETEQASP